MRRNIEDIQSHQQQKSRIETNMRRVVYDGIHFLNPSSIAKGLVDHKEVDPTAIKYAFENPHETAYQAALDRMDRGTLAHMMLLQPGRLAKDVARWTGKKRDGTVWDEFCAVNGGKLIVRDEDYNTVEAAVQAFQFLPAITELLTDLDAEVAMFSREHSFYVKGMVDAVTNPREGVFGPVRKIIDIKTTEAGISDHQVIRTVRDFRNREKMAAYRRWYAREQKVPKDSLKCVNLFLSMVPPYGVRIVDIPDITLDWGEERIVAALDAVQRCLDAKSWPMFVRSGEALVESWEMDDEMVLTEGAAF